MFAAESQGTLEGWKAIYIFNFHVRITLENKFEKKFCICDEYVINLFVCIYEVRKGT